MSLLSAIRARLRALVLRARADRELRDEIGFHLDRETDKNIALGFSPDEARRLAIAHFGGVESVRESHRDVRRAQWLEDFVADARFALRAMRRTPALAGAAVGTLALGIGANVAIFSAVNAVVLQPLPFPGQDRLMVITEENPEKHWHLEVAAAANLLDWRARVPAFQDVTGYTDGSGPTTLTGRGDPQLMSTTYVMGNFFSTLGIRAALGRAMTYEESFDHGTHVLVLSDRGWRAHFGADPNVIGKSAILDGKTFQIIGVMPPGFAYPAADVDAWQSVEWGEKFVADIGFRRAHWLRAVARLKRGASIEQANAQLQSVVAQLKVEYPQTNKYMGALMMPLHDYLMGDTRLPLLVLLTSVAFLLLIACANVGNLLLVQAAGRVREATLRVALGAGRSRLVRQAFTESLVLSMVGGACGLALGWVGTRALVRLQPHGMLRVQEFGVDHTVLGYVAAITIVSALVFGVAPALWARHRNPADALKEGGRGAANGGNVTRWRDALVAGEVALALLMTVGAGLLVRSFVQLGRVEPGFDPHGVLATPVQLSARYDTSTKVDAFMQTFEARLRSIPGVTGVGLASSIPFKGTGYTTDFVVYGWAPGVYGAEVGNRTVTPSYFATMRVPVLRGRVLSPEDRSGSGHVLVINQALADQYFKGEDPVGRRLAFTKVVTPKTDWYTIIGVVGNEHVDALDVAPRIEAFHAEAQEPANYMVALVRTSGNPAALVPSVRAVLHDLDPKLALLSVDTMDGLRDQSLARARFLTLLLGAFAVVGIVLAVVGVYSVLAQLSRNRTREFGIRVALGAQSGQVQWLVVRQGLRLTLLGLIGGGLVALFTVRLIAKLLFNVAPNDPETMVAVIVLLTATSAAASWIPARKASRADPAIALRSD